MHVLVGCFLCKKITKKHFAQLKTIDIIDRKIAPFLLGYLTLITHLGTGSIFVRTATRRTGTNLRWAHETHAKTLFA